MSSGGVVEYFLLYLRMHKSDILICERGIFCCILGYLDNGSIMLTLEKPSVDVWLNDEMKLLLVGGGFC